MTLRRGLFFKKTNSIRIGKTNGTDIFGRSEFLEKSTVTTTVIVAIVAIIWKPNF